VTDHRQRGDIRDSAHGNPGRKRIGRFEDRERPDGETEVRRVQIRRCIAHVVALRACGGAIKGRKILQVPNRDGVFQRVRVDESHPCRQQRDGQQTDRADDITP
jgi:hypothetical protein